MRLVDLLGPAGLTPRQFRLAGQRALYAAAGIVNTCGEQPEIQALAILRHLLDDDNAWDLLLSAAWIPGRPR